MTALQSALKLFASSRFTLGDINGDNIRSQEYCQDVFRKIILKFLEDVHYRKPSLSTNDRLMDDILLDLKSWNIEGARPTAFYTKMVQTASGMAELTYPFHTYDIKKQIAMFTFFMLYVDDLGSTMPSVLAEFQKRMILRVPQVDSILQRVPSHLAEFYNHYDALCANAIVVSGLDMITGTALETREEVVNLKVIPEAQSWPIFPRDKTGIAPAYAHMIFELVGHNNIADYLQAIPDINTFLSLTNDLFSFYKEELEGERHNYIYNRAKCDGVDTLEICAKVAKECAELDQQICTILYAPFSEDQKALERWKAFKIGYINFHITMPRYRLVEIGV